MTFSGHRSSSFGSGVAPCGGMRRPVSDLGRIRSQIGFGPVAPRAERQPFEARDLGARCAPPRRRPCTSTLQPVWYAPSMPSHSNATGPLPRAVQLRPASVRNTIALTVEGEVDGEDERLARRSTTREPPERRDGRAARRHSSRSSSSSPVRRSIRPCPYPHRGPGAAAATRDHGHDSGGASAFRFGDSFVANTAASVRRSIPSFESRFET